MKLLHWPMLASVATVVMYGCGPLELTSAGSKVRITRDSVTTCELFGDVIGSGRGLNARSTVGIKDARTDIKNEAGEMGANVVVLETDTQTGPNVNLSGQAYKCPE